MNKSVLIAMSGGVDSSVAAAKLVEEGFRVVGATMWHWDFPPGAKQSEVEVAETPRFAQEASQVAVKLGLPHHIIDLRETFRERIVSDFIAEYRAGRTPNPCVRCNALMKWGALWDKKNELNLDYLATGHYARVLETDDGVGLFRAANSRKDQSYALWAVPLEKLSATIFPLGESDKESVRSKAADLGLKTVVKTESQEICFIPLNNYGEFLEDSGLKAEPGDIIDHHGDVIGRHKGIIHYTIGQRKGLGGGAPHPLFVVRIDPVENIIHVGPRERIIFHDIEVTGVNWLTKRIPHIDFRAVVKVRYLDKGREARVSPQGEARMKIHFPQGVEAPTPGQSAVVYIGDRVIGGGIIAFAG